MRILVYPHDLGIGGSQINAIELAAAVGARGHDVAVFGAPGPLVTRIRESGLEFIESPIPHRRPSPAVLRALSQTVQERRIDVLHGYEWPPILESWIAAGRGEAVAVGTVMSMAVADFLPRHMPLLVGTRQIAAAEQAANRADVAVLEPPVDLRTNHPDVDVGAGSFRRTYGLGGDDLTVVTVTRLAHEMKLEGLLVAIDTVADLAETTSANCKLVIVGDGQARREVEQRARQVNRRLGRDVVILTGEVSDPRPAYAASDIVLGMGSSALRAMAFGKPLIVQGERGFWKLMSPESAEEFLWTGWYGVGESAAAGPRRLRSELDMVLLDPARREELGRYSLRLVTERFSSVLPGYRSRRTERRWTRRLPSVGNAWIPPVPRRCTGGISSGST